ncbi:MAG: vWA domain-containing protein [Chloroflexota bacterium]
MSLLWPAGLLALAAVPVILLLHMRHIEPLVRRFPSVRFWQALPASTTPRQRFRRPPLTLPLVLQLLAALALGLALARPLADGLAGLPGVDLRTEPRRLVLLLDGSSSMAAAGPDGSTRWDAAKAEALARLGPLSEGDAATVLALGTQVRSFGATDGPSLARLRERIAALPLPGGRADLDAALALAADLRAPGRQDEVVLVTDGALAADPETAARLGAPVELAIVPGGGPNAAIVAIAAAAAVGAAGALDAPALQARIVNFGPEPVAAQAVLLADGFEAGRQAMELPADGGSAETAWAVPAGTRSATVRLEHADALPADNEATLPLARGDGSLALRVLLVSDSVSPLERALAAIPGAALETVPGDALERGEQAGRYDLVVLESVAPSPEALARLDAPMLIVSPQPGGALPVTGVLPDPAISRIRAGDPLLAGVDLAGTTFSEAALLAPQPGEREILGSPEGPLALRMTLAGHEAIVLAFDLNGSNLPRRIAFPIMIANAVAELAPAPPPAAIALGDTLRFEPRAGAATVEIAPPAGEAVALAAARGADGPRPVAFAGTGLPGAYRITERDAAGAATGETVVVVNAGHPRESDLRPNPGLAAALAAAGGGPGGAQAAADGSSQLWPLLALLALLALAAEWLAALWPRPRAARAGGGG